MKGVVFHQQLELRAEVAGEEFHQGDEVRSTVSVKNRGADPVTIQRLQCAVSIGDMKKVKAKDPAAFQTLDTTETAEPLTLAAGAQVELNHLMRLSKNCLVTDKSHSLCVVYGLADGPQGHLQLNVLPHSDIEGILQVFETSFQFVTGTIKSKGDRVIAPLKPPMGKLYTTLEKIDLGFSFVEDALLLDYQFKVTKLEAGPSTLAIQKKKQSYSQTLRRDQYAPTGFIDSKLVEPLLQEALACVENKFAS